ncbi:radical SAM family heme chaperone HemW [Bacillus carboniphilus]|uniref:Heme chaperone HemW n=1 Tax=Bacillus carboniphilus TaxID=86663 RepID=A0ABY9JX79_9BACI|nr:radical SAM family heme chaperone HemW [Bacillus carboniphilus]WLR43999.1 radical SAM family heme chaperone HemW [Bacillus carboniphilus]
MPRAVYIHIPFCKQICHYCDFNKYFIEKQPVKGYLQMLEVEIKKTFELFKTEKVETIFVGGGTPTALNSEELSYLLSIISDNILPLTKEVEYSFECNPDDLTEEKLALLKQGGVNRLSFGVQTFDKDLLKKIGRTHRADDVYHAVEIARALQFKNISLDLMFGLPGQTMEVFLDSLKLALSLDVPHYSSYSLIVEPKTVFYNRLQKGKLHLPPQEQEAMMFEKLMTEMKKAGRNQYEISNFSMEGYESIHNLTYWNNEEYYGFGAGAHSYVHGVRRVNARPLNKYMSLIKEKGTAFIDEHLVTRKEMIEEEMFLGLRKTKGVSVDHFKEKFSEDLFDLFGEEIQILFNRNLLKQDGSSIYLTEEGKMIGNEVFQSFLSGL